MPVAAGNEIMTTALQQSIFGAPPSSLPLPVTAPTLSTQVLEPAKDGNMDVDSGDDGPKGVKRAREEESDDEEAPMEEDSDAPMEASSDEDEE